MTSLTLRAAAVAMVLLTPVSALAQKTTSVYAHIVDASGLPVLGLAPADFQVTEGGLPRKIVHVTFGGDPLRVLFLVDTSDAVSRIPNQLRAAMQALIDGLPPGDEIALVTMGRQMRIRVQPTTDHKKLKDTANGIFADGGGTVLLDSLIEADDRVLAKATDRAPVIVILTSDGPESSTSTREEQFNKFVVSAVNRGAVFHAVVLAGSANITTSPGAIQSGSAGTQSIVAMNLTANTGGHLDSVNSATSLADKMRAVADQIAIAQQMVNGWYQIDYATDSNGGGAIEVVLSGHGEARVELKLQRPR